MDCRLHKCLLLLPAHLPPRQALTVERRGREGLLIPSFSTSVGCLSLSTRWWIFWTPVIRCWKIKMKEEKIKRLLQQEHLENDFLWYLWIPPSLSVFCVDWHPGVQGHQRKVGSHSVPYIYLCSSGIWNSTVSYDPESFFLSCIHSGLQLRRTI